MLDQGRREFMALLGGAATWPVTTRARQPATPVIGVLASETPEVLGSRLRAFHQGLSKAGFVEGRNVAIVDR